MIYMKVMGRTHNEVRIDRLFTCGCSGKIFGGGAANGPRKSDFSLLDGGSAVKIIFLKFA